MKKLLVLFFVFVYIVGYCQIDNTIYNIIKNDNTIYNKIKNDTIIYNKIKNDTIIYNTIGITDTLLNLQSKINQLEQQNYLLKDGMIKFKEQTYKGQNNLLKGMILTTAGVVNLSINKDESNVGVLIIIGGVVLDIQGILDMYKAYKHLNN